MMKKYKKTLILSSLVTLLPIAVGLILWNHLPELIPIHLGADGQAHGMGKAWIIVFLMPIFLLVLQWFGIWLTFKDPKTKNQSSKAIHMALWIVPITSIFSCAIIYISSYGYFFNLFRLIPLFVGIGFFIIGNYMPKITQNSYLGIKIKWTLYNEENWNQTHRFCGKTWVIGGLCILVSVLLPEKWMLPSILLITVPLVVSPILYSYLYYRKQVERGLPPILKKPLTKKRILQIAPVLLGILILASLFVYLMFSGEIQLRYDQDSFTIEADFWSDLTVEYDGITSIAYDKASNYGTRNNGFSSARLNMGSFYSEAYGNYTLYGYTGDNGAVVLRCHDRILVLTGNTPEATAKIYENIKEKIQ